MKKNWEETLEKVYEEIYLGDSGYAELEAFVKNLLAEQKKELMEQDSEQYSKVFKEGYNKALSDSIISLRAYSWGHYDPIAVINKLNHHD